MNKKFSSFVLEGRISIETRELAASQHICKYIIRIEKKGFKVRSKKVNVVSFFVVVVVCV